MIKNIIVIMISMFMLLGSINMVSFAEDTEADVISINVLDTVQGKDYLFNGKEETIERGNSNGRVPTTNENVTKLNTNSRFKYEIMAEKAGNYTLTFDYETQFSEETITNGNKTNRVYFQIKANDEEVIQVQKLDAISKDDWSGNFIEGRYESCTCEVLIPLKEGKNTFEFAVYGSVNLNPLNITTGGCGIGVRTSDSFILTLRPGEEGGEQNPDEEPDADTINITVANTTDGKFYTFNGNNEYSEALVEQAASKGTTWIYGNSRLTYEVEVSRDSEYILSFPYLSALPAGDSAKNPIIMVSANGSKIAEAEVLPQTAKEWHENISKAEVYTLLKPVPLKAGKNTLVFAVHYSSSKPEWVEAVPSGLAVATQNTFTLKRIKSAAESSKPIFDTEANEVSAIVSLNSKNEDGSDLNAIIIMAVYENGYLADYKTEQVSLANGEMKDYTVKVENISESVDKAKVFVWGWDGVNANVLTSRLLNESYETTR